MECNEDMIPGYTILEAIDDNDGSMTAAEITLAVSRKLRRPQRDIETDVKKAIEAGVYYGFLEIDDETGLVQAAEPRERRRRRARGKRTRSRSRSRSRTRSRSRSKRVRRRSSSTSRSSRRSTKRTKQ